MAAIDFPNSPSVDDTHNHQGVIWRWDGEKWKVKLEATSTAYSVTHFEDETSVTVSHYMGSYPIVQVVGDDGEVLGPLTIDHAGVNQFTVTFAVATTGRILASKGSGDVQGFIAQQALADQTTMVYDAAAGVNAIWTPGATRTLPVPTMGASDLVAGAGGRLVIVQSAGGWGVNLASGWGDVQGDDMADFAGLATGGLALLAWTCYGAGQFFTTCVLRDA